jgi:hypothetical protein
MTLAGAVLQQLPPPERPGDRLDHGVVDAAVDGSCRDVGSVRRKDELSGAAPADRNRHSNSDGSTVAGEIGLGE